VRANSEEASDVLCDALNGVAALIAGARRASYCALYAGAVELCEGAAARASCAPRRLAFEPRR
jgi:hypothetical protein